MTNKCYFDKRRIWQPCEQPGDCEGCPYEPVIAATCVTICQYCGKEVSARYCRHFSSADCRIAWQAERLSYDHDLDGGLFWGEPIFTLEEYGDVQRRMLGLVSKII